MMDTETRIAPFDPRDYMTRQGHELREDDTVVVLTPVRDFDGSEAIIESLIPRAYGETACVAVQDLEGRRVIVNAVNVELVITEVQSVRQACSLDEAVQIYAARNLVEETRVRAWWGHNAIAHAGLLAY
jgi:hypothetical protein